MWGVVTTDLEGNERGAAASQLRSTQHGSSEVAAAQRQSGAQSDSWPPSVCSRGSPSKARTRPLRRLPLPLAWAARAQCPPWLATPRLPLPPLAPEGPAGYLAGCRVPGPLCLEIQARKSEQGPPGGEQRRAESGGKGAATSTAAAVSPAAAVAAIHSFVQPQGPRCYLCNLFIFNCEFRHSDQHFSALGQQGSAQPTLLISTALAAMAAGSASKGAQPAHKAHGRPAGREKCLCRTPPAACCSGRLSRQTATPAFPNPEPAASPLFAGPEFEVFVFGHPKEGAESHEGQLGACEQDGATCRAGHVAHCSPAVAVARCLSRRARFPTCVEPPADWASPPPCSVCSGTQLKCSHRRAAAAAARNRRGVTIRVASHPLPLPPLSPLPSAGRPLLGPRAAASGREGAALRSQLCGCLQQARLVRRRQLAWRATWRGPRLETNRDQLCGLLRRAVQPHKPRAEHRCTSQGRGRLGGACEPSKAAAPAPALLLHALRASWSMRLAARRSSAQGSRAAHAARRCIASWLAITPARVPTASKTGPAWQAPPARVPPARPSSPCSALPEQDSHACCCCFLVAG